MKLEGLFKEIQNLFKPIEDKINEAASNIKEVASDLLSFKKDNTSKFNKLDKELATTSNEISLLEKSFDSDIVNLKAELSSLKKSNSNLIEEVRNNKESSEEALKELIEENRGITAKLKSAIQNNIALKENIKSIEQSSILLLEDLKTDIKANNKNSELFKLLNNIEESSEAAKLIISGLENKINENTFKIDNLASLNSSIKELKDSNELFTEQIAKITNLQLSYNKKESSNYTNTKSLVSEIDNKVNELTSTISNFKLSKKDILRILQEEGNIDLLFNLKLSPRVLPKNTKPGVVVIDAKDNKLKFFTDKWNEV